MSALLQTVLASFAVEVFCSSGKGKGKGKGETNKVGLMFSRTI